MKKMTEYRPKKELVVRLAELSRDVYCEDWCKNIGKLADRYYINNKKTDTQCVIIINRETKTAEIVFRGTSSGKDILTDVKFQMSKKGTTKGIHKGFLSSFISVWGAIKAHLSDVDRVIVCGHSLGSSLAQICALYCAEDNYNTQCVGFAGPMIGNKSLQVRMLYSGAKILLVEHFMDRVVYLPPSFFNFVKMVKPWKMWKSSIFALAQHKISNYISDVKKKYVG